MPKVLNLLISAGVGAGDIALEEVDARAGRTEPFKRFTDYYRVGLWALGLFGDMIGVPADIADTLAISTTPLVEKTVWSVVKGFMAPKGYEVVVEEVPSTPASQTAPAPKTSATVFSL